MKHENRLINETSPYLLQHAHNPVNWYPWGEEALQKAKTEDKPILVSIGYSACHWCHVMEKECFEDEEVASLMNKHFINIKIDREERPDVDQIYMEAVQIMGLQGGWPLNVLLTPDQKPFYGGTYFPKPNWMQLLQNVENAFKNSRHDLENSAEQFVQSIAQSEVHRFGLSNLTSQYSREDLQNKLDHIFERFAQKFDQQHGGLNKAPKFPMPSHWLFLLRYFAISNNQQALQHLVLTLDKMASGGIYDQIGGGFSRYSVDGEWFALHFEKMLYDNAQLLSVYAEAYTVTKSIHYRHVLEDTVNFVKEELTGEDGGFYSALDADSEGEEGKYYVWTSSEVKEILQKDAPLFCSYFNVVDEGNWESGNNILHTRQSISDLAQQQGHTEIEIRQSLDRCKKLLKNERNKRIPPGLDDKILSSWNGLMLKGLADTYAILQKPEILELASQNAAFIKHQLITTEGGLYRTYKNGQGKIAAYLEDYAFVIDGLISLYQVTFDEEHLKLAQNLADYTILHFFDEQEGFFYYTDDTTEKLIARKTELFDNVIPSSNSAIARVLYKLGTYYEHQQYQAIAEGMLAKMVGLIEKEPEYLTNWACFLAEVAQGISEVAIVGEDVRAYAHQINLKYFPFKILMGKNGESSLPLLQEKPVKTGQTQCYVCYERVCQAPVSSPEETLSQL